jgi:hypothetical protein
MRRSFLNIQASREMNEEALPTVQYGPLYSRPRISSTTRRACSSPSSSSQAETERHPR